MKMPNAIGAAREMAVTMESCRGLKFFAEAIEETRYKIQGTRHKGQGTRKIQDPRSKELKQGSKI
jgi:hypothetical protein